MNMSSDDLGPESQGLPAFLLHLAKISSRFMTSSANTITDIGAFLVFLAL